MTQTQQSPNTLTRQERLRRRGAVSSLFSEGESGFVFPIRFLWREVEPKSEGGGVEVLFTVPKRLHKRANKRNLLRRRVKEAYRLQKGALIEGKVSLNIALIYSTKEIMEYEKIERAVEKILAQISHKLLAK